MKERVKEWLHRPHVHKKRTSFVIAAIVVLGLFFSWMNFTNSGHLFQDTVLKQVRPPVEQRDIDVYDSGQLIAEYNGLYVVEKQGDSLIIYNPNTHERIDFHGDNVVIVDKTYQEEKSKGE